jgi:DNA-directed RNA polymerase subunit RPC12/RpoP
MFVIAQTLWIYLDSKKLMGKFAILWAMFGLTPLIFPIILPLPIIIYFLITKTMYNKCHICGSRISRVFAACPECGAKLKERCKRCGTVLSDRWNYCPYCNTKIPKDDL